MRTAVIVALATIALAGQCLAANPTPEEQLKAATATFGKHVGDFGKLNGKQGDIAALNTLWAAVQSYVNERLDQHTAPLAIEKQAPPLNPYYSTLHVVAIGQGLYAVSTSAGQLGNVFISGKRGGHFATLWDIRQSPLGTTAWGWDSKAAEGKCGFCRAASGSVTALTPDAAGRPRFYVDALYAQDAGATMGAQLSVWRVDGRNASILLKKNYVVVADDEYGRVDQGPFIRRHNKHEHRMFFACGSCLGRTMTWTVKVSPDGVTDLGETADIPEADIVDDVFFRLWHGKDAHTLARPAVIAQMASIVADVKKLQPVSKFPTLGMVMGVSRTRKGSQTVVEFDTDVESAPVMRFVIDRTNSGLVLTKLDISQEKQPDK